MAVTSIAFSKKWLFEFDNQNASCAFCCFASASYVVSTQLIHHYCCFWYEWPHCNGTTCSKKTIYRPLVTIFWCAQFQLHQDVYHKMIDIEKRTLQPPKWEFSPPKLGYYSPFSYDGQNSSAMEDFLTNTIRGLLHRSAACFEVMFAI